MQLFLFSLKRCTVLTLVGILSFIVISFIFQNLLFSLFFSVLQRLSLERRNITLLTNKQISTCQNKCFLLFFQKPIHFIPLKLLLNQKKLKKDKGTARQS